MTGHPDPCLPGCSCPNAPALGASAPPVPGRPDVTCATGCGNCCDPVNLWAGEDGTSPLELMVAWTADRWRSMGDPRDDAVWAAWPPMAHWARQDDPEGHRQAVIATWDDCQAGGGRPNADFAAAHWRPLLGPEPEGHERHVRVHCDAFDRHTRTCTVHAIPEDEGGQPPICSQYPRYGLQAGDPAISYGHGMDPHCTYNADVRTFLPIVDVR